MDVQPPNERHRTLGVMGVLVALGFFSISLTPSLVPRPALFLGLLSGLWAGIGYFVGAAIQRWLMLFPDSTHTRHFRHILVNRFRRLQSMAPALSAPVRRTVLLTAAAGYALVYGGLVIRWQNGVRSLVEMEPLDSTSRLVFIAMTIFGCAVSVMVGLGLGWVRRRVESALRSRGSRFASAAGLLASTATAVVGIAVLLSVAMLLVEAIYAGLNEETPEGISRPTSGLRSGGPGSAVTWDSLGRHGRAFAGGGPDAARIEAVTGTAALEPVRVYVGVRDSATLAEQARIAVAELKRTGGFDRSVLVVATTTGSGWLEAQAVDSVEYLHGGDTAIVSMQYSYLPSWASFLFNEGLPIEASRQLFDAVHAEWVAMPAAERPQLAVYGLSLGALGMQGALGSIDDIRDRTDAALFAGPPNNSQPWRTLTQSRDDGSPVWLPVLDEGATVRWLSAPGDFEELDTNWQQPRVAFLQHATDAVTWLDPEVIWRRPEWLAGQAGTGGRGSDVSDAMVWFPGVTYLHLVADMIMGVAVPAGHGHNYGDVILGGWAGVLPDHELNAAALDNVQTVLESYSRDVEDPIWE